MSNFESKLSRLWVDSRVEGGDRLRRASGAQMQVMHLGDAASPLFAVLHRPPEPPVGVVVVCSPPYVEAVRNHRREQLFGWLASDSQLATVRFHPRGAGNSGGDSDLMTMATMEEDALQVASQAVELLEAPLVGFLGARLGAVVAHRAALAHAGTAVAWWHPVLDADAYARELLRARMIGSIKTGVRTSSVDFVALLQGNDVLDVLGSPLSGRFYGSLFTRPLDDAPPGPRNGLIVQMSRHRELQKPLQAFFDKLCSTGWSTETLLIADEETWWFGGRGRAGELEVRSVAMEVIPATVAFFRSSVGGRP